MIGAGEFAGKVALITAGGAGIGRSIAVEWAALGGTCVVTDLDGAAAQAVAAEIGDKAHGLSLDVRSLEDIKAVVARTVELTGGIDALFNVAGVNVPRNVEEMSEDEWDKILETNMGSVYRLSKYAIPHIRARGGGSIVNIASAAGVMAENRCGAYSASKAGVMMLTRNMAMDFAKDGIRVNSVAPGSTRTPRIEKYWEKSPTGTSEIADKSPLKRSAEPEEIARPAVFLASSWASYMTGDNLVVDGGLTAGIHVATFERL